MQSPSITGLAGLDLTTGQTPPLFERLVSDDVQELKSYARIVQDLKGRVGELERVNDDLEGRLERQAVEKMGLEAEIGALDRGWGERFRELEEERDAWRGTVQSEQRKNNHLREQVYRKDKELHRMLQRKYDGGTGNPSGRPPVTAGRPPTNSTAVDRMRGESVGRDVRGGESHKSPQDLLAAREKGGEVKEQRALRGLFDFFGL